MANYKRSRIKLSPLSGAWYQGITGSMPIPSTAEKLAMLAYGEGNPEGVLIRYKKTGLYALWQFGGIKSIDQTKAKAAHEQLCKKG